MFSQMILRQRKKCYDLLRFCHNYLHSEELKHFTPPYMQLMRKSLPNNLYIASSHYHVGKNLQARERPDAISFAPTELDRELRGKAVSSLQGTFITDALSVDNPPSFKEWDMLLEKIIKLQGIITEQNIDGKIMEMCVTTDRLDIAKSYLLYMKQAKRKVNSATAIAFNQLCYKNRLLLTEEDIDLVKKFTNYLQKKYEIIDNLIGDSIVKGLYFQKNWQKIEEILQKVETDSTPGVALYSSVIVSLLECGKIERAISIMLKAAESNVMLEDDVYITWINKFKNSWSRLKELLSFFKLNDIIPKQNVCNHLVSALSGLPREDQLLGTFTTVSDRYAK